VVSLSKGSVGLCLDPDHPSAFRAAIYVLPTYFACPGCCFLLKSPVASCASSPCGSVTQEEKEETLHGAAPVFTSTNSTLATPRPFLLCSSFCPSPTACDCGSLFLGVPATSPPGQRRHLPAFTAFSSHHHSKRNTPQADKWHWCHQQQQLSYLSFVSASITKQQTCHPGGRTGLGRAFLSNRTTLRPFTPKALWVEVRPDLWLPSPHPELPCTPHINKDDSKQGARLRAAR
jgi:hypothetical protein